MAHLRSVVIVDDHEAILYGLQKILEGSPSLRLVALTKNRESGLRAVQRHKPDLVCLDLILPEGEDFTLLKQISEKEQARVVIYTSIDSPTVARGALQNGAVSVVSKGEGLQALVTALSRAGRGKGYLSPCYRESSEEVALSPRQREILALITSGMSNPQIADELGISGDTVKTHVASILRALQVSDRTEAAVLAVRRRLI